MKKILSIVCIMIFSAGILTAQPKLEIVGGNTYDWKEVSPKNTPLKAKIKIKNSGDKTLKIFSVKPACSCTAAPLEKYELEPGETVLMRVTLDTKGMYDKVDKIVNIKSNDPANADQTVYLKAKIVHPIGIYPRPNLIFGRLKVGDMGQAKLVIKNMSDKPITINGYTIDNKDVKITLEKGKVLNPGESTQLFAIVKAKEAGNIKCTLHLLTNHPDYPDIKIFGNGRVM